MVPKAHPAVSYEVGDDGREMVSICFLSEPSGL